MKQISVTAPENGAASIVFYVERACDWLGFAFRYDRVRSWICCQLWDPSGRLRFTHLDFYRACRAVIHHQPMYTDLMGVSGPIESGAWRMTFACKQPHAVTLNWECGDGVPSQEWAEPVQPNIAWSCADERTGGYTLNRYDWQECLETGYRWYKGDFHTHSQLSDGKMEPEQQMMQAKKRGLDFFAVTDHNLLPASWPAGDVLVIPGIEFTSLQHGHWNALGLAQWLDWTEGLPDDGVFTQDMQNRLMEQAGRLGALRSINHPMMAHFSWTYMETPLSSIDVIEIMNSPNCSGGASFTEKALHLWGVLWNEGYPIPGIGGSDTHLLPDELYKETGLPSLIGDPANYVYASCLSASSILQATRSGRVYVSRGPVLDISIMAGEERCLPGSDLTDAVRHSPDGIVHGQWTVRGAAGGELHVIENGAVAAKFPLRTDEETAEFPLLWKHKAYVWARVDIRSAEGALLAFTNPVYCGSKRKELTTWGELLAKAHPPSDDE